MSDFESVWKDLSPDQASLMGNGINYALDMSSGLAAQQAGIGLLNADRYSMRCFGKSELTGVAWPNIYRQDSTCVLFGDSRYTSSYRRGSFQVISDTQDGVVSEGVFLNPASTDVRIYGIAEFPTNGGPEHIEVAVDMLRLSEDVAPEIIDTTEQEIRNNVLGIIGVRGAEIATLMRSLNSLTAHNLVFTAGLSTGMEAGIFSDSTYDLATTLLKLAINDVREREESNTDLIDSASGQTLGAKFETANEGIVIIYRTGKFPDRIKLVSVNRPKIDEPLLFAEQFEISARDVTSSILILDSEDFDLRSIFQAIQTTGAGQTTDNGRFQGAELLSPMDDNNRRPLEQRISKIITDLTTQNVS